MKLVEAFAKAFFYTKLGEQANKLANLYTFDIYEKNLLGLIDEYLKFKKI